MLLLQFAFIYTTAYVSYHRRPWSRGQDKQLTQQGLYGALVELARRPEYIQPLREEVEFVFARVGASVIGCDRMTLLDSFLKECQRLHPPAAGTCM